MAECTECGVDYSDKRAELGYKTCLPCGDQEAKAETDRRRMCLAPAYNKGPYMYVTSREQVKDIHRKGG